MDFIDIVKAIFYKAGVNIKLTEDAEKIDGLFKKRNKTVFILVDGMGALLIKNLLPNSFLDKGIANIATTLTPSTTSVVLTSLTTGKYPAEHSMNGWFNYIEETNESIISLPFVNRFNSEKLVEAKFEDVFFGESLFNKLDCPVSVITKTDISKSDYSKWFRGNSKVYTYRTLKGAFQTLSKIITKDNEKEFIYLYIDDFDSLCHKYGPDSEEAKNLLKKINDHIEKFARIHSHKVNAVITADHGQVPIKNENFFVINNEDKMIELLKAPPSGDSRFVCFHVKTEYL
jgi:predicted AlkP superfamily pyrophosphatase or phosphodiesterase